MYVDIIFCSSTQMNFIVAIDFTQSNGNKYLFCCFCFYDVLSCFFLFSYFSISTKRFFFRLNILSEKFCNISDLLSIPKKNYFCDVYVRTRLICMR